MKRILTAAFLYLIPTASWAGCSVGALPFQLQNNTVADATQVMADFNQIVTGVNSNCAAAGANNDITSLGALATPISVTQGGTPVFISNGTGGSANAQTVVQSPSGFTLTAGYHVTGAWSFTNTGAMTLQVGSTAAAPVWRKTQAGPAVTQGGEALAGEPFDVFYNGSVYIMDGERIIVGEMRDYMVGVTPPAGWFVADGSTFVCGTYPQLCALIGTQYGGTASNPALPDTRGRLTAGLDNYGTSIGAAGRLTSAATGCGSGFAAMGVACANASQSHTQLGSEVGAHNHAITDPGHTHALSQNNIVSSAVAAAVYSGGTGGQATTVTATNSTTGITINNSAAPAAMPIVNPNLGVVKIIRY